MSMPLFRQMPAGRQSGFGTRPHSVLTGREAARIWQENRWFVAMIEIGSAGMRFAVTR